ncbi:MAG: hypothetical protein LBI64_02895 [Coriobacteriales bacterium]|nr:hypothetical protein [Coriobacteriales bacterium]
MAYNTVFLSRDTDSDGSNTDQPTTTRTTTQTMATPTTTTTTQTMATPTMASCYASRNQEQLT